MNLVVNAKTNDPITSVIAGEAIENGKADYQRLIALAAVKANPGLTSKELSRVCELDRYQLARRLPEIARIKQGSKRYCRVGDNLCVTWWLTHD